MSLGPNTVPTVIDLFNGNGTATGTRAETSIALPPGRKAVQVGLTTSATCTVKIQNSLDKVTWFDISSSTVSAAGAQGSFIAEVDSVIPHWRVQVSAYTTSGTGNIMYASIAQLL